LADRKAVAKGLKNTFFAIKHPENQKTKKPKTRKSRKSRKLKNVFVVSQKLLFLFSLLGSIPGITNMGINENLKNKNVFC
jgi:hypothetical protein